MAAEAQRATSSREPTSIALRPPRVVTGLTSMAHAAAAMSRRHEEVPIDLALEVFTDLSALPHSFIVHRALDATNAPLIRRDEIVIVDTGGAYVTGGWYPVDGGLFLIEYTSGPTACERYARRSRSIVQTYRGHKGNWYAGSLRRGLHPGVFICVDGPYSDEQALADKLIGKVVGIYSPPHQGERS